MFLKGGKQMNFAELMEFHPATAVRILEAVCLITVILFTIVFQKTFGRISGKVLIGFFALSRLPDMLTTIICLKRVDYSHEANFLLRWFLTNNYLLSCITVIMLYNLLIFLDIYLFYKRCYNHSNFTKLTIKAGFLTFSLTGALFSLSNFLNL